MKLSSNPHITVIIATYNRTNFLKKCIEGILSNSYDNYEIIVVDQGKNDETRNLIERCLYNKEKLRYLHTDVVGLSHARNIGYKNATGEIIAFIDDDAVPVSGWLEAYAKVFTEIKPTPAMAGGKILPEWEIQKPGWYPDERLFLLGLYDIGNEIMPFPETDLPIGANFAMLRGVIEEIGGFDDRVGFNSNRKHSMIAGEDSLMGLQVRAKGYPIYYQPDAQVFHFISSAKLSKRYFLRRHFWEGVTFVVLEDSRNTVSRQRLQSMFQWHVRNVLREGIKACRALLFGASSRKSSERMLYLSKMAHSIGLCSKSAELIFRKKTEGLTI